MPPRSRARNAPPSPPTQPSLADTVEDTEAAQPEVARLPAHSSPLASALPPKAESPFINAVHLAHWPGPIMAWFRGKYGDMAVHDLIDAARQALAGPKVRPPEDS